MFHLKPFDSKKMFHLKNCNLQDHLISLVEPYYNHVGFQESDLDAHLTVFSRSDAMSWACRLEIQDCVTNAKDKYAKQMADPDNSE